MLTPNYGCVGATDKFTCSDTVSVLYCLGQRPRLVLAQTSLAVKKTTRTSGGDFQLII